MAKSAKHSRASGKAAKTQAGAAKAAEPKKIGRPPRPAEQHRAIALRVMVTREEQEALQAAAETGHVSLSTWVRVVALREVERLKSEADAAPRPHVT